MEEKEAVILANGDFPSHPVPLAALDGAAFVCCCDGAAEALVRHGLVPHAIVGDGDSLPDDLRRRFADRLHIVREQEFNDLTKATRFCVSEGFSRITYLGCTGRREDHALGNISLMAFYMRQFHIEPTMLTDCGSFVPAHGSRSFKSHPGQQVSIFNLTCTDIRSEGLKWDAYPYKEWWQGTLNESLGSEFRLLTDGTYLLYRTHP